MFKHHAQTSPASPAIDARYQRDADDATAQAARANRRWNLLGNARLIAAIPITWGAWRGTTSRDLPALLLIASGLVAFIAFAAWQRRARRQRDAARAIATVNHRALARYRHDWSTLPPLDDDALPGRDHPYAWDLNIVGPASLLLRISTPVTHHGWQALRQLLLDQPDARTIPQRQAAIAELAGQRTLRQHVEAVSLGQDGPPPDPAPLVAWAQEPAWLADRRWLLVLAWIGPLLVLTVAVLAGLGLLAPAWLALPLLVNGVVFFGLASPVPERVQSVGTLASSIAAWRDVDARIAETRATSPHLQELVAALGDGPDGAARRVGQLARLSQLVIPPQALLYVPLQLVTLWDVHLLAAQERWRSANGRSLSCWLAAAGEWEALAALSVLAHDHPDWAIPTVTQDEPSVTAAALAHPLLPADGAVSNDVTVGPRGSFLFVTGSNMSGKSTLLRAVGLNAVLAMAGGPVRAGALRMPPVRVHCCMRVEDSLAQGVSFFLAELTRLKAVVDAASAPDDLPALYLLDEMLQGTNTGERQIASRIILRQLVRSGAIGAISSHDLALLDDELAQHASAVHFADTFIDDPEAGATMSFDYRLRPGIATSSNALHLMRLLGFKMDDGA